MTTTSNLFNQTTTSSSVATISMIADAPTLQQRQQLLPEASLSCRFCKKEYIYSACLLSHEASKCPKHPKRPLTDNSTTCDSQQQTHYRQSTYNSSSSPLLSYSTPTSSTNRCQSTNSSSSSSIYSNDSNFYPIISDSFFDVSLDNNFILIDSLDSHNDNEISLPWLNSIISKTSPSIFNILHININSVCGPEKRHGVDAILSSDSIDFFVVEESKLGIDTPSSSFDYPNYNIIRRDRVKGGGGILIFIKKNAQNRSLF